MLTLVKVFDLHYNTPMAWAQKVAKLLIEKKKSLCLAESCTGGLLTHQLTNIPGSSQFLKLTIVAYSNESKVKLLKVPKELIKKWGAVSEETAVAMAQGARNIVKTDFGLAITGIAGPGGGTQTKPIGLCFVAISSKNEILCVKYQLKGNRLQIKSKAVDKALKLLIAFSRNGKN